MGQINTGTQLKRARGVGGDVSLHPDDFSTQPNEALSLLDEQIADRKQYRAFRHYAFFGIAGLITVLITMFALWVGSFGLRVFGGSMPNYPARAELFLTPIIVIASLVAVAMLPIVRLVFRQVGDQDDSSENVTIWQTLIREIADTVKAYLGRSKTAA